MKLFPSLPDDLARWAARQPVFFTGSAATHGRHVNVSPKGLTDCHFAVLGPNECAYIDRTGSGCETIAHAYDNGRLCILFISFGDSPRILRLFCRARVIEWDHPSFARLVASIAGQKRQAFDGARAVILCHIWEVQTSCGYGVPRVKKAIYAGPLGAGDANAVNWDDDRVPGNNNNSSDTLSDSNTINNAITPSLETVLRLGRPQGDRLDELSVFETRPTLDSWAATKVEKNSMLEYQTVNNAESIDGLPGLRTARRAAGQHLWLGDAKARWRRILAAREAAVAGFVLGLLFCLLFSRLPMFLSLPLP